MHALHHRQIDPAVPAGVEDSSVNSRLDEVKLFFTRTSSFGRCTRVLRTRSKGDRARDPCEANVRKSRVLVTATGAMTFEIFSQKEEKQK